MERVWTKKKMHLEKRRNDLHSNAQDLAANSAVKSCQGSGKSKCTLYRKKLIISCDIILMHLPYTLNR